MVSVIRKKLYLLTSIILLVLLVLGVILKIKLANRQYQDIISEDDITKVNEVVSSDDIRCSVDIKGAVKEPGVYVSDCTSNVQDIIELAGGLLEEADTSVINLAKKINDQMVILVYTRDEVKNSNIPNTVVKVIENECVCPSIKNDSCINTDVNSEIGSDNKLININEATLDELLSLPGIGEAKANAIIEYRRVNGNFTVIQDILNVSGIGQKLYEEIQAYITT